MNDTNQVVLVGRLSRDTEVKYLPSGLVICNFGIAVTMAKKQGDQWVDDVSFFEVSAFGKTVENLSKYLLKGKQVAITGRLKQDRWEKDGQKQSKVSIVADGVQLLGSNGQGKPEQSNRQESQSNAYQQHNRSQAQGNYNSRESYQSSYDDFTDEIPF